MKRNTSLTVACTAMLALASFFTLAEARTPVPTGAFIKTRVFNDCPTSTLTVNNSYPSQISIEDADNGCLGFANLHVWRFSEDGGANPANFDNHSSFRFSTTLTITGARGEAGLQIAPWFSQDVDGRLNVRIPDGEIAAFGGRLPFYSFSNAPHSIRYAAGNPITLEIIYEPHGVKPSAPGTIEYRVTYLGNDYTSGQLPFDEGNVVEGLIYGNWGILNQARVGGYFQPNFQSAGAVVTKATFDDIEFETSPDPNSAVLRTRIFDDCPTSTLSTINDYPAHIQFKDEPDGCGGFANLHNWSYSQDGVKSAEFNNNVEFNSSASLVISGTGHGEAGLRLSPWYSQDVDGRFNVRPTDGEIACFGGRLPFYSFSNPPHNVRYARGEAIHLDMRVYKHSQTSTDPATIEYSIIYQGQGYTSGQIPFDMGNPTEEPPYGLWGPLNDGRSGGYLQAFVSTGNLIQADFQNIRYDDCNDKVASVADVKPARVNRKGHGGKLTATVYPNAPRTASEIDPSSVRLNGVPGTNPKIVDGGAGLRMKFDRAAVVATLPVSANKVPVFITGDIGEEGCFEALEFLYVKEPKQASQPEDDDNVAVGARVTVLWDVPTDVSIPKVSMLKTLDNGATWSIEAENIVNDGSYEWTVSNTPSTQVRLALGVLAPSDEFGPVVELEVAETGAFTISTTAGVGGSADAAFAIRGIVPNPSRKGPLNCSITLPSREAATLGLYDVSGRQVALRDVGSLGAGRHTVTLGARGALRPGVYMVKLTQGGRSVNTRAVVIE